jgi:hypothetical protein
MRIAVVKQQIITDSLALSAACLEKWCNQIDRSFADMDAEIEHSLGPRAILESWRVRLQKFTSIAEQSKRRDVRTTITLLSAVTKGPSERIPPTLFQHLRRWKELDIHVTEAGNEVRTTNRTVQRCCGKQLS